MQQRRAGVQCGRLLIGDNGRVIRPLAADEFHSCPNGCDGTEGGCLYNIEPTHETNQALHQFRLCADRGRQFCWPDGGGPRQEPARLVNVFTLIKDVITGVIGIDEWARLHRLTRARASIGLKAGIHERGP